MIYSFHADSDAAQVKSVDMVRVFQKRIFRSAMRRTPADSDNLQSEDMQQEAIEVGMFQLYLDHGRVFSANY